MSFRLHKLVTSRQQEKKNLVNFEKKLQEEKKQRSALEQQLTSEKRRKAEEAAAIAAATRASAANVPTRWAYVIYLNCSSFSLYVFVYTFCAYSVSPAIFLLLVFICLKILFFWCLLVIFDFRDIHNLPLSKFQVIFHLWTAVCWSALVN